MMTSRKFIVVALSSLVGLGAFAVDKVADPLQGLQWGIQNTGQVYSNPITDLIFPPIQGKPGVDVDIIRAKSLYSARMQKEIVVAVIDSGVDINHPDLAGHIFVNAADCDSTGKAPFHPADDKDKNGYKGDCNGWNVSGHGDENRVDDDMGHGTHVSGIIAAVENNGVGVQGVASKVKILPIKLTYDGDTGVNYSARLVAALKYALKMKADVVNMSLGWSSASDTPELHQLIQQMAAQGTVIVVAAGNNTSNRPIYPCAYEEAICVGALNADNSLTDFSNYGGHVDLLAPGANILSTIPSVLEPQNFSMNGYDYKNGTSQAAPFVAGAVAVLKSVYPAASTDEIRGRLLLSAVARPQVTASLGGLIQIGHAIEQSPREAVYPVFKGDDGVRVDPQTLQMSWALKIKNFWAAGSDNVQVDIVTGANVKLAQSHFDLGSFKADEAKSLGVAGVMNGLSADRDLRFQVKVTQSGRSDNYVVDRTGALMSDSLVAEKLPIDLSAAPQFTQGHFRLAAITDSFAENEDPEYFAVNTSGQGTPTLAIFQRLGSKYIAKTLALRDGETVFKLVKIDADQDGKPDYVLQTYVNKPSEHFELRYLNSDLKPLYDFDSWAFDSSNQGDVLINWREIAWLPSTYKGRTILMPVFDEPGVTTTNDADKNPFDVSDETESLTRIYYLSPNSASQKFDTHTFLNYKMKQTLLTKLKMHYPNEATVRFFLPQSIADLKAGRLDVLLEIHPDQPRYVKMTLGHDLQIQSLQSYQGTFDLRGFDKVRQPGLANSAEIFLARVQPSSNIIEFARLRGLEQPRFFAYTHKPLQDTVIGAISAATEGQNVTLLTETKTKVVAVTIDSANRQTVTMNSLNHISILSNLVFSQLMTPIRVHGKMALYIDSSQLYRGDLDVLSSGQSAMAPAIQNSVELFGICDSVTPVIGTTDSKFAFSCDDQNGKSVTRVPVR